MLLMTKEQRDANGLTLTETAAASNREDDDTDDVEDVVSPDSSSGLTKGLSASSGEEIPRDAIHEL